MKLDKEIEVWGVYDTWEKKWWSTPKGKYMWKKSNYAAAAWTYNPPRWAINGAPREVNWGSGWVMDNVKFSEQHRYVTKLITRYKMED